MSEKESRRINARSQTYLKKAADVCTRFAPGLSKYYEVLNSQLAPKDSSSKIPRGPYTIEEHKDSWKTCKRCEREMCLESSNVRIKPKPKTTRTIMRLLRNRSSGKVHSQGKFVTKTLDRYFNDTNLVQVTCSFCQFTNAYKGQKRSDPEFIKRYECKKKDRRKLKKEMKKKRNACDRASEMMIGPQFSKKSQVDPEHAQASPSSSHEQTTTPSPMQMLKSEQLLSNKKALAAKRRCDSKRSEERRVGKECRSRWSPYH